jgi:ferrous iron transport protein B
MELPPYRWPALGNLLLHMWERSWVFLKQAGSIILAVSILLWALMYYPHNDQLPPAQALEHSLAGQMGKAIEPILTPLGFDWRIGVGLIGSLAAREVFVSTMGIIFNMEDQAEEGLQQAFAQARWPDGKLLFTPLVCIGLMVFYVFAMQCLSTTVTVRRETNSWRWPLFQFFYMSVLAYLMTWLVIHLGSILGFK